MIHLSEETNATTSLYGRIQERGSQTHPPGWNGQFPDWQTFSAVSLDTSIENMERNVELKYSGRCLCGEISYSADVEPLFTGNCHCKDCQRSSGSAFTPAILFLEQNVSVLGEARYFETVSDSGSTHKRGFCSKCGSQLFAKFSSMPGMLGIKAGTLDYPSFYVPKLDFYVASAAPWDFMNPELPKKTGSAQS